MNEKFYQLSQEKQDRIWNAALKVFAESNYRSASTIEIAKEAEISKALLFHYFLNKKELYFSLYRYCMSYVINELSRTMPEGERDFFNIILNSQTCKCEIMSKYKYMFEFLIKAFCEEDAEIINELNEYQQPLIAASYSGFLQMVDREKFKDGVDLSLLFKMLIWCGDGCMREKFRQPTVSPQEINREFSEVLFMLRSFLYKEEAL